MPELPEIEVIRRSLSSHLVGRRVCRIVCSRRRLRQPVPRAGLQQLVENHRIILVDRRAKYLLIRMSSGATLSIHLGMSGRLELFSSGAPRTKHDHLRFLLDNETELRFNDSRRFGAVQVMDPRRNQEAALFAEIGPEPLEAEFSPEYLIRRAKGRTRPIKNFLMDHRVVAGIGNIYANEILFAAGVHPGTPAGTLKPEAWGKLLHACRWVLSQAIDCGGTTIADFANGVGEAGAFQSELKVYDRQGEPCVVCAGTILRAVQAGRASYYCPACQQPPE
jgi:formamidopyrimidine-DNA glycosylase